LRVRLWVDQGRWQWEIVHLRLPSFGAAGRTRDRPNPSHVVFFLRFFIISAVIGF
jgi:hypothetical protein